VDVLRASRWGEPVEKFISCVLQHGRDRYFIAADDDSWLNNPYWVCAYANNQWAYAPISACACCRTCAPKLRVRQAERRRDGRPGSVVIRQGDGAVGRHTVCPRYKRHMLHAHLVRSPFMHPHSLVLR
jgi:hypothetical protein